MSRKTNKKISVQKIKNTLILTTILCVVGIFGLINNGIKTRNYKPTKGVLIEIGAFQRKVSKNSKSKTTVYKPIYSYTIGSETYTIKYENVMSIAPKIGSTKTVRYNPKNPSEAVILRWYPFGLITFYGAFFTLFGRLTLRLIEEGKIEINK